MALQSVWYFACVLGAAALISAGLNVLLRPLLLRHALAHPNARSSHRTPTPQGGGIAVLAAATLAIIMATALFFPAAHPIMDLWPVFAATLLLAFVGAVDDIVSLPTLPRFLLQVIAVAVVVAWLPSENRIVPILPWWLERLALVVGGVWFVNLVNFMDGIDWMMVAETVPVTIALAIINLSDGRSFDAALSVALLGGAVGFAPFNRPIATLFLGNVGSLPIALILFWLLIGIGSRGHLAAAVLLPLYFVADTTITLMRRMTAGQPITKAHRDHFYQRATAAFSVLGVVGRVFATNVVLVALALVSVVGGSRLIDAGAVLVGSTMVGLLLFRFSRTSG